MAVNNKDFKVKHGLIVEGTTGTINGYDILTKNPSDDQHIIDVIGGEATPINTPNTVVKRDGNGDFAANTVTVNTLSVPGAGTISDDGELLIEAESGEDIRLRADDVRVDAVDDFRVEVGGDILLQTGVGNDVYVGSITTGNEVVVNSTLDSHIGDNTVNGTSGNTITDRIATAKSEANSDTDTKLQGYTTTANLDTTVGGFGYLKEANLGDYATKIYADNAAAGALEDAQTYADALIDDASNSTAEVWSAYKTNTEIGLAEGRAKDHADEAVAALVDGAPALLDTLNELAAAIADNPNYATDVANLVAGKQDTLTAGANINITGATISVTGLDTADVAEDSSNLYFTNTRAKDAVAAALGDGIEYANGTFDVQVGGGIEIGGGTGNQVVIDRATVDTWYDANGAAADALQEAKDYADALDTDDIAEGSNLYYTDIRAKGAAADLLVNATKTNITITGNEDGLTITAEDGIAGKTTDDLTEGEDNLYFLDQRAIDALQNTTPTFSAVDINSIAKQVAGTTVVPVAGVATAYSWAKADYRSAEFLVKIAQGGHTQVSKVLLTLQDNDNISITEYGVVGTNGDLGEVTATISGNDVQLQVDTVNNTSTVTVVGTLLV